MWTLAIAFTAMVATIGLVAGVDAIRGEGGQNLDRAVFLVFPLLFVAIPLTLVLVLIRYRLWDLERVVNKTLVYGTLAGFISLVYVAIVVGIGSAVGSGGARTWAFRSWPPPSWPWRSNPFGLGSSGWRTCSCTGGVPRRTRCCPISRTGSPGLSRWTRSFPGWPRRRRAVWTESGARSR